MLAVKKLMLETLLSFRFRGTTMSHDELLIALENIFIDKVSTVPTARSRKIDTSAPMAIRRAAKGDGENSRKEEDQRIMDIELQAFFFSKELTKATRIF